MDQDANRKPDWYFKTIDLKSRVEVKFWCQMLQCSEKSLLKAVSEIGHTPQLVDHYLELNRLKLTGHENK